MHEGARDSPSLVCRGRHPVEHPGCVVWDAAGTHKRQRPRVAFFSRQGEKSERSGITLPDTRGWSTQSDRRGAVTLSLREGRRRREAPRREEQCDRTVPHVTKTPSDTCTTRERACASDRQHTAQAAHAHVQPHVTPTWFQCASRVSVQHDTNKHINHVCVRAATAVFAVHHLPDRPTRGVTV